MSKESPIVYLTYEGAGAVIDQWEAKFLEEAEAPKKGAGKDVLLRLHNNSCWSISFASFSMYVPRAGGAPREFLARAGGSYVLALPDGVQVGVYYDLREEDGRSVRLGWSDMHWVSNLPAGRSVTFSVPKRQLRKGRVLSLKFQFEWEEDQRHRSGREPVHQVEIYASGLN